MLKYYMLITNVMLSIFLFVPSSNGLRGALVRTGRSLNLHEGNEDIPMGSALNRAVFFALKARQQEQQKLHEQPLTTPIEGNAFLRFGRSLFDAGAESSSILRSQRGILQQEQPMIVIDADDGQLMRYGRKK